MEIFITILSFIANIFYTIVYSIHDFYLLFSSPDMAKFLTAMTISLYPVHTISKAVNGGHNIIVDIKRIGFWVYTSGFAIFWLFAGGENFLNGDQHKVITLITYMTGFLVAAQFRSNSIQIAKGIEEGNHL